MSAPIERIKKLLRMRRGGTPAEIETALSLAREIAAKHGIDLNAINENEERPRSAFSHAAAFTARRVPCDAKYAANIVQRFFNVQVVFSAPMHGKRINFIGRVFEIEIAIYIFRFLRAHFSRSWREHRGRLRSRRSFVYGMYIGIAQKLSEQETPAMAEAIVQSREEYIAREFGPLTSVETQRPKYSKKTLVEGYFRGRETELRKGVERARPLELSL